MGKSKIDYLDYVINFVTGCTPISNGCKNCYAKGIYQRFDTSGKPFNEVRINQNNLYNELDKLKNKTARIVGINFLGDTFHDSISFEFIDDLLKHLKELEQHQFIILTKRYKRLRYYLDSRYFDEDDKHHIHNIHFGVSICDDFDLLNFVNDFSNKNWSNVRLIFSIEPLLEHIANVYLDIVISDYAKWVIVGGESGNKKRLYKEEWAWQIKNLCDKWKVPFYHKQQFINNKKTNLLYGKEYLNIPNFLERYF